MKALASLLACALTVQGCTLVGLGIGAATPKVERTVSSGDLGSADRGKDVTVRFRNPGPSVRGELVGIDEDKSLLLVRSDGELRAIPFGAVAEVEVHADGTNAATGAAVGGFIDAVVILFVGVIAARGKMAITIR